MAYKNRLSNPGHLNNDMRPGRINNNMPPKPSRIGGAASSQSKQNQLTKDRAK